MAQVSVAYVALHLHPLHVMAVFEGIFDGSFGDGLCKTGPAGYGMILFCRVGQRAATAGNNNQTGCAAAFSCDSLPLQSTHTIQHMRLAGNILDIKEKRDSRHQDIALYIDRVEYITLRKDGKYFQPFDFVDELDTPLVLTGDCLARITDKNLDEGEYAFQVYDKTDAGYALNENKHLSLSLEYDFDEQQAILSSVYYTVTVSNEEFKQIKRDRSQDMKSKKGKKR